MKVDSKVVKKPSSNQESWTCPDCDNENQYDEDPDACDACNEPNPAIDLL